VELILRKLSEDAAVVDILEAYPHPSREDILAALSYAAEARLRRHLRDGGLSVRAVREECPRLPDRDVLARAVETDSVLLTEHSDFGEWICALREPSVGVVFTRYRPSEIDRISSIVLGLCTTKSEGLYGKFTTVTSRKIPTRGI
jgi:predicted nuclease of predicted toxin-antitoxin system